MASELTRAPFYTADVQDALLLRVGVSPVLMKYLLGQRSAASGQIWKI